MQKHLESDPMRMPMLCRFRNDARRRGFTLVELLVVISVIVILMALLVPAIRGAVNSARIAQVRTDISALEQALADFDGQFGSYPPSRITLWETAAGWNSDPASKAIIRRFWPQFDFSIARSFGGTGTPPGTTLTGGECLVFFLGGVVDSSGIPTGFSKNPLNPFAVGGNRSTPLFTFNTGRLSDLNSNGFPEYVDPLPSQLKPYLYLSAYDGQGYDDGPSGSELGGSGFVWAYRQGDAAAHATFVNAATTDAERDAMATWKPNSYQIISPGFDGQYGVGGVFDANSASEYLYDAGTGLLAREAERDNITNFHSGRLAQ